MGDTLEKTLTTLLSGLSLLDDAFGNVTDAVSNTTSTITGSLSTVSLAFKSFRESTALTSLGLNQMTEFMSRVGGQISSLVGSYNPSAVTAFRLAVVDSTAALGSVLQPALDRFKYVVQGLGDLVASLTPEAKAMAAGLVAAGVGMATMTALTYALSTAFASATGGISILIGTIVSAAAGIAFVSNSIAEVQSVITTVMKSLSSLFNTLGDIASSLARSLGSLIGMFTEFAASVVNQIGNTLQAMTPLIEAFGKAIGAVGKAVFEGLSKVFESLPALGDLLATLAPVVEELGKAIAEFTGILISVLGNTLSAMVPIVVNVAEALLKVATMVVEFLGPALELIQAILSPVVAVLEVLAGVFNAFVTVLLAVGEAIRGPLMGPLKDFAKAANDAGAALVKFSVLFGRMIVDIGRLLEALANPVIAPLVNLILGPVATGIRALTALLEGLAFILEKLSGLFPDELGQRRNKDSFKDGASQGLGIRNVGTTTVEGFASKVQQSAFGLGKDANAKTADNTDSIKKKLDRVNENLVLVKDAIEKSKQGIVEALLGFGGRAARNAVTGK